jgi:hypothetical protein
LALRGLGYTELKNGKEPTGKYKSSGYGDLKENKMSKSTELKELLERSCSWNTPQLVILLQTVNHQLTKNKFAAFPC